MKKKIAKLLRKLANKLSPPKMGDMPFPTVKNYEVKKIGISRPVNRDRYEQMLTFCKKQKSWSGAPEKSIQQLYINEEGEWLRESITLAIKESDAIEFEFDKENFIISARIFVGVPIKKEEK